MRLARTATRTVRRVGRGGPRRDTLTVEEPLQIEIVHHDGGEWRETTLAVTMRTPGDDRALAAGFLFTEGIVASRRDVARIAHCPLHGEEDAENVINVRLRTGLRFSEERLHRHFYTTSSCGVCGKTSLEAVRRTFPRKPQGDAVRAATLQALPDRLRAAQRVFARTGGLHAAGIFTALGRLIACREDIGRHNALDKVIGEQFLAGALPLRGHVVAVSGRASFELVQKTVAAGAPVLAAVGAPSSLAVDLAREYGLTLVGFLRPDGFNVYSGAWRVRG